MQLTRHQPLKIFWVRRVFLTNHLHGDNFCSVVFGRTEQNTSEFGAAMVDDEEPLVREVFLGEKVFPTTTCLAPLKFSTFCRLGSRNVQNGKIIWWRFPIQA